MSTDRRPGTAGTEEETSDLSLRRAESADEAVLADLFIAARRAAHPAMPPAAHTDSEIHGWFEGLLASDDDPDDDPREVWVAERGDAVVGYVILDPEWLHSLYIRPELTGQGIGAVLLDLAKSLRPEGFGLWVFESNVGARRFYLRHGLAEAERTDGSENEEKAPDIRMVWPGAVADLRNRINEIDDRLAALLDERAGITAEIQRRKPVPGHAGRDAEREAEIVARMAERAPNLGPDRIQEIMRAVIRVSLDAADRRSS